MAAPVHEAVVSAANQAFLRAELASLLHARLPSTAFTSSDVAAFLAAGIQAVMEGSVDEANAALTTARLTAANTRVLAACIAQARAQVQHQYVVKAEVHATARPPTMGIGSSVDSSRQAARNALQVDMERR